MGLVTEGITFILFLGPLLASGFAHRLPDFHTGPRRQVGGTLDKHRVSSLRRNVANEVRDQRAATTGR